MMAKEAFDYDVIVAGAGAAGLFAATEAALHGQKTLLLEKNRKAGIKILASGGTKCNVTSSLPIKELGLKFGVKEERFLRHGLHECSPQDVRDLLQAEGVATGTFPMEKIFPLSGRAADVLEAFLKRCQRTSAELALDEALIDVEKQPRGFRLRTHKRVLSTKKLIITVGGCSYPKTGTTGDGYPWLQKLGHTLADTRPALVPLLIQQNWLRALTGIACNDVIVEALGTDDKVLFGRRRPLLFTHRGLSGPGPMDVSGYLRYEGLRQNRIRIDWLPDWPAEDLDILLRQSAGKKQTLFQVLPSAFPRRLMAAFLNRSSIPEDRMTSELKKKERQQLVDFLKRSIIKVDGDEGFDKAEVTTGGLPLEQVSAKTMESKIVRGLYIAGEILDLDGPIGGFNFQAAFSTGTVAGRAAATARGK